MRYTFPTRIVYRGDQTRAAAYLGDARALLGALAHDLAEANIRSGKRVRDIGPARLEVSYDGTLGHIAITVSTSGFSERMPKKPALWVPRGFVVYPAVSAAPHGWGLPVQQLTDDEQTPYSPANITPGTDVSRWTVGGPLGQVLLTRVPDGGYPKPDILLAPVCFSRSFGPKVDPADPIVLGEEGGYVAERLRLTGFTDAQSPSTDDAERARIVAFKRGIFERVNAHRVDIGRDPIAMPLFGHYDSAQISSEQCFSTHTFGHYSERFPLTFRTPEDRVTKDGMRDTIVAYPAPNSRNFNTCENAIANALSPPIPLGVDPDGIGIFDIPSGGTELTAQSAFDGWMASPHHREQIEQVAFDRRGMYGATTGVGLRQNYGHQQFIRQEQWVSCGNRVFECPDGLSPISWFGPPSMNLAWETWPAFLSPSDSDNPIILLMENFGFYEDTASWLAYYMTTRETDYRFGWTPRYTAVGAASRTRPGWCGPPACTSSRTVSIVWSC